MDIKIIRSTELKAKPDWDHLPFGTFFTDHMLVIDYTEGQGWHDAAIVPYQPLVLDPAAIVYHYGVEIFEGMKAYYTPKGEVVLFRPEANAQRLNRSGARLCMPELPVEDFVAGVKALVALEKDWTPQKRDASLYIRPFMIATEAHLGVSRSKTYKFIVILCPVGAYYPEGLDPVRIFVEDYYARAAVGGTGFCKCGGNYAASLAAQYKAKDLGYSQVLWLDGAEHRYVDEVGTMNVMFRLGDQVVTPSLDTGSILPGITRDSVLRILRDWGVPVAERQLSIEELQQAAESGLLKEAFGTGTAAVISPIGELNIFGKSYVLGNGGIGQLSQKLYDYLTDIQWGRAADPYGWVVPVED